MKTLTIEHDNVYYNRYSKPLYHQCDYHHIYKLAPPMLGVEMIRCGRDACYLVSWDIYTLHLCQACLAVYTSDAAKLGYTITDNRQKCNG